MPRRSRRWATSSGPGERFSLDFALCASRWSAILVFIVNANGNQRIGGLRDLRVAAGLSQEALAREVGCSTAYVRVLERGYEPNPESSAVYRRIVAYLNDNGGPPKAAAVKTEPVETAPDGD